MTHSEPTESFEIERKYAVSEEAQLPGEAEFAPLGLTLCAPEWRVLEAHYFDTPDGALGAQSVAVRRRSGGPDAGWHLKERGETGARELMWPPADSMPTGLVREIRERIGEAAERVRVIARLHTVRIARLVADAQGAVLVEVVDDRVEAVNELTGRVQRWREWEAELVAGAEAAVLDRIEPLLVAAGAERVRGTSKIQRVMSGERTGAAAGGAGAAATGAHPGAHPPVSRGT